jgi:dihydrodipicolinate synthase/N-acetylneuraminate lyase
MKDGTITFADLTASVMAVPPLGRSRDLKPDEGANATIIRHLENGGVSTLLYGGNANFYNIGLYEYAEVLDLLERLAAPATWVVPGVGPDFGKMMDQAAMLRSRRFPAAMVLPIAFPSMSAGVELGIRRFAERFGRPVIVYLKAEGYLEVEAVAGLVADGLVCAVKYAIVRAHPEDDAFLRRLLDRMDGRYIVSGMGERPVVIHAREFGLRGFTSGSVCIAPQTATRLLAALQVCNFKTAAELRSRFLPLEEIRDRVHPITVLHEAVALAGIADMGPMLPLLANLPRQYHDEVRTAALELLAAERSLSQPASSNA